MDDPLNPTVGDLLNPSMGGPECDPLNVGGPGSWKSIKGRSSSSSSLTGDSMIASRSSGMFERSSGSFLSTLDGTSLSESETTGGGPSGDGTVVVAMGSIRGNAGCGRMFVAAGGDAKFAGRLATAVDAGECVCKTFAGL